MSLTLANLTGNARLDVATANYGGGPTGGSLLLGNGTGGLECPGSLQLTPGMEAILSCDVDNNGTLDLVAVGPGLPGISVLRGDGQGHFGPAVQFNIPGCSSCWYYRIAAADLNLDGNIDLVALEATSSGACVFLGDGIGNFTYTGGAGTVPSASAIAIADFNGDGNPDVAIASYYNWWWGDYVINLGDGHGGFQQGAGGGWMPIGNVVSLAAEDIDRNGAPDLVATGGGNGFCNSGGVGILMNDGTAHFVGTALTSGPDSYGTAVGDLDGDGNLDIAATSPCSNTVSVFLGNGSGGFSSPVQLPTGLAPWGVGIGDLNQDGRQDLIVTNSGDSTVSVLLNGPQSIAPAYHVFLGSPTIPLANVVVTAEQGGAVVSSTTTGSDGSYSFTNPVLPPGSYTVRALITYDSYIHPNSPTETQWIYAYPAGDPGSSWCLGCTSPGSGCTPDQPSAIFFPWPVVLQGGWDSSLYCPTPGPFGGLGTWEVATQFLTEDPGDPSQPNHQRKHDHAIPAFICFPVPKVGDISGNPTPAYDASACSTYDGNADTLAQWIEQWVKPALSPSYVAPDLVDHIAFSLLCHSMGGPIVRALATRDASPPIDKIVSMDGIHGGAYLNLFGHHINPIIDPYLFHLSELYMNGAAIALNQCSPRISGWNSAANTDLSHPGRWLLFTGTGFLDIGPDLSTCGHGRVLRLWSLLLPELQYCIAPWVDGTHRTVADGHGEMPDNPDRLVESTEFLLGQWLQDQGCPQNLVPEPAPGQGFVSGTLDTVAGTTVSVPIPFDTNRRVRGEFLRTGAGMSYLLRAPNGSVLTLEGLQSDALATDTFVDTFQLTMPPAGTITLELTGGSAPALIDYSLVFANGNRLRVEASPYTVSTTQQVQVNASLRDFDGSMLVGLNGTFTADVTIPQSPSQTLALYDDGAHGDGAAGDGIFGNSFGPSPIPGQYLITCRGTLTVGSEVVARSESSRFDVAPAGIALVGSPAISTPDANGDGRYDSLVFTQTVSLAYPRSVSLAASLVDRKGQTISAPVAELLNPASGGSYAISLVVPGTAIVRHGVDGPWTLTDLAVYDLGADGLPAASGALFTTQAYSASTFAAPAGPQVFQVIPSSGPRLGGSQIVLRGSGLLDASSVTFGGNPATFVVTGDTSIAVTVPPIGNAGGSGPRLLGPVPVDVRVTTPWGTIIAVQGFTYTALQPR